MLSFEVPDSSTEFTYRRPVSKTSVAECTSIAIANSWLEGSAGYPGQYSAHVGVLSGAHQGGEGETTLLLSYNTRGGGGVQDNTNNQNSDMPKPRFCTE